MEHPCFGNSWKYWRMNKILHSKGVQSLECDQCRRGPKDVVPMIVLKKCTSSMTSPTLDQKLVGLQCSGRHKHQQLHVYAETKHGGANQALQAQVYLSRLQQEFVEITLTEKLQGEEVTQECFPPTLYSREDKEQVSKTLETIHVNLWHPDAGALTRMLQTCGASEVVMWVAAKLKCATCAMNKKMKVRLKSKLRIYDTSNQHVNIDVFTTKDHTKEKLDCINIVCEDTCCQVVVQLWPGTKSGNTRMAHKHFWKRCAGTPDRTYTEGGDKSLD